jgi:hypothetical protein
MNVHIIGCALAVPDEIIVSIEKFQANVGRNRIVKSFACRDVSYGNANMSQLHEGPRRWKMFEPIKRTRVTSRPQAIQ